MNNILLIKKLVLFFSITAFLSCNKDFNSVGHHILGNDRFITDVDSTFKIVAFNRGTGPVQTNGLPINSLGIYNNPAFGKTTANFVTQLVLAEEAPIIGNNPVIDEVILYIPYFSRYKSRSEDGTKRYELDSIYGNSKIKLNIYESGYYLRDFDPENAFDKQRYYSGQNTMINTNKLGQRLNDSSNAAQNDAFFFSSAENKIIGKQGEVLEAVKPGMLLTLNKDFFQNKIFGANASGKLLNNNVFKEYFRGFYFQVESLSNGDAMIKMKFTDGKITIKYKEDAPVAADPKVEKSIVLNLAGNSINLFENDYKPDYKSALDASNPILGDDKLYIKGGEGSVVYIDLFDEIQLTELRSKAKKRLINEANLEFYIDKTEMNRSLEPNRIYIYNAEKNTPILDYRLDATSNVNTKLNKGILGGIIEKGVDNRGTKYKIRLTEHIKSIVKKDSANVRLGFVVTEDINQIANSYLKTPYGSITRLPAYSVINQLGTILYGTTSPVPEDKKLKLKIYYTESN